ncbi:MAG: tRNA (N(6)-L-threonylcarbamoyladenosine(37)-C(2))-methylthiotransferase [Candidatus Micrarchaeota archaeon]|nr:tRNA (N(6)-L-threonylcarbamoyladenosine(37)-C(2))-methylthiotransferase [Candidatus Micrarchaeota archaeon]
MKFFLLTYGCTLNSHDSELMRAQLVKCGHTEVGSIADANVAIINTCGVKDATEKRIINVIKSVRKPLVVCGCLASGAPGLVRKFAPKSVLVGTYALGHICDAVMDAASGNVREYFGGDKRALQCQFVPPIAAIAAADGCTSACTYCFTRLARPGLKSVPVERIVQQVKDACRSGVKEVRLTAQDMGAYGIDIKSSLSKLLAAIAGLDLPIKVRIGMMNPKHLLPQMEAIDIMRSSPIFYRFYHIPAQSGSDTVLKAMGRGNTVDEYMEIVREVRRDPDATIMNDIIVGFPGESDADFEASMDLCRLVQADTTNISKYSRRPGTPAASLKQVPRATINGRSRAISELCDSISLERNRRWVGRTCTATLLEKVKTVAGRNDCYKQVVVSGPGLEIGMSVKVRITGAGVAYIRGELA